MTGKKVMSFDFTKSDHQKVLDLLKQVDLKIGLEVNKKGILRPRPNEVGNDIEPFVKNALNKYNYKADTPKTISGKKKSTGYPDIEFIDEFNRYNYLECKTYNINNIT
jgi:hypothetical protein